MSGSSTSATTATNDTQSGSPSYTVKTIYGDACDTELSLGLPFNGDTNATLNHLYKVQDGVVPKATTDASTGIITPAAHPTVQYFGVGISGRRALSTKPFLTAVPGRNTNMNLYTPFPIRARPIEQDLTADEMKNYRMRSVVTLTGGGTYALYYLKLLQKTSSKVQYQQQDAQGKTTLWTPDYADLQPPQPTLDANGSSTESSLDISALATCDLPLLGSELLEAIGVLYGNESRYAFISEIGIYTGVDQTVVAHDYQNKQFTYTEALIAQLYIHRTFMGIDMSSPTASLDETYSLGSGNLARS